MHITREGYAEVEGTSLYYEISGRGSPVVLLHGFSADLRMWDALFESLAPRHTVLRYDLRGFGRSAPSTTPYSHAEDLRDLLDVLDIRDASLVGCSMGGGAALNTAIQFPFLVRALVLADPTLGGFQWSNDHNETLGRLRDIAHTEGVDAARAAWLAIPMLAPTLASPLAAAPMRRIVGEYSGWHWTNRDPGRPFTPPAAARLADVHAPTLVLVGALDTPDFHRIALTLETGIRGAKRMVLPGVGHMANLEDPAQFSRVVTAFLDDVDGATF